MKIKGIGINHVKCAWHRVGLCMRWLHNYKLPWKKTLSHVLLSVGETMWRVVCTCPKQDKANWVRLHRGATLLEALIEGKRIPSDLNEHRSRVGKFFSFSTAIINYHNIGNVYCQDILKESQKYHCSQMENYHLYNTSEFIKQLYPHHLIWFSKQTKAKELINTLYKVSSILPLYEK